MSLFISEKRYFGDSCGGRKNPEQGGAWLGGKIAR